MNNLYAKFKLNLFKLHITHKFHNLTYSRWCRRNNVEINTQNHIINVHKILDAHLQCVNNHDTKLKYKGMNTVGDTDYKNYAPPKHFG